MFLSQVAGVSIFILIAVVLTQFNISQNKVFIISSICAVVYMLANGLFVYRHDYRMLHSALWPYDDTEDVIPFLRRLLNGMTKQNREIEKLQYGTEKLLVENIQLRKAAQANLAPAHLLKDIADAYKKILDIRSRVKQSKQDSDEFVFELTNALMAAEQGQDSGKILNMLDSITKVMSERRKLQKLKQEERKINFLQKATFKSLSSSSG